MTPLTKAAILLLALAIILGLVWFFTLPIPRHYEPSRVNRISGWFAQRLGLVAVVWIVVALLGVE
jgi:hypothetical protein